MTLIKFCGLTREEDVTAAIDAGVDAIGVVLWPGSPRHVELTRARTLIEMIAPHVIPVGVFVSPSSADITRAIEYGGIKVAQVHGTADAALTGAGGDIWFAASLDGDQLAPPVANGYTVLLDAHDPERHGGTGRTIDWTDAARVAARRPVILAGGLTPANVAEAVRRVRPYGVDVASGIETRPGVKDVRAMRAFVAAVREAEQ